MSPTQLTLKYLRDMGYTAQVVEKWNPHASVRQDLFGFIDVLAFKEDSVLAVQATTSAHINERLAKILALREAYLWVDSLYRRLEIHGWGKTGPRGKRKEWSCREIWVTPLHFEDFEKIPLDAPTPG